MSTLIRDAMPLSPIIIETLHSMSQNYFHMNSRVCLHKYKSILTPGPDDQMLLQMQCSDLLCEISTWLVLFIFALIDTTMFLPRLIFVMFAVCGIHRNALLIKQILRYFYGYTLTPLVNRRKQRRQIDSSGRNGFIAYIFTKG